MLPLFRVRVSELAAIKKVKYQILSFLRATLSIAEICDSIYFHQDPQIHITRTDKTTRGHALLFVEIAHVCVIETNTILHIQ